MEKINIAELLKDCPSGMELDCTIFEDATFEKVRTCCSYPIKIISNGCAEFLTEYGCISYKDNAKCVIFPKGKTTWEGFQRSFKDGDIVVAENDISLQIFILKGVKSHEKDGYSGYCYFGWDFDDNVLYHEEIWEFNRLATEEEKQKLFDAIKENGYKWNAKTKTLEKLIEPKFKIGDRIKKKKDYISGIIINISDGFYRIKYKNGGVAFANIKFQDDWELVLNKFDITTLKPFESKVLVRSSMDGLWKPAVFGFRNGYNDSAFYIVGGSCWKQCIPYLNNEHLCGTTNNCDEYYKTWE